MANYDSNYAIAQEISARIGTSPIPFDSVYSIALEIYNELGGEPTQFDSVYSILLGILPLVEGGIASKVIDDSVITTVKTWSSSKLSGELATKQNTLTAGTNIDITNDTISAKGYTYDETTGSLATKYKQDAADGGQIVVNTATGLGAVAEGYNTQATGDYGSHAEGTETVSSGSASHAEGNKTQATAMGAHAAGYNTQATGKYSHTEGDYTVASNRDAHAEGWYTNATGRAAHAEGLYTDATGDYSHAEGWGVDVLHNLASGRASHAEGIGTKATNMGAHAEGYGSQQAPNTASAYGAHAEGCLTIAQNQGEHAEGNCNVSHKASDTAGNAGNTQHSVGISFVDNTGTYRKNAVEVMQNGDYYLLGVGGYDGMHIKTENGYENTKTLQDAVNSKQDTLTAGSNISISSNTISADGYVWNASTGGFAEKYKQDSGDGGQIVVNTVTGLGSHAEGYKTTASGDYGSHAEGCETVANGAASHAEGFSTEAQGQSSHAEGQYTKATNYYAHAEGNKTNATGAGSHAEGFETTTQNMYEHAEGTSNYSHTVSGDYGNAGNTQHSVGVGGGFNTEADTRKNAFEIMQNGDMYVLGVGGYQGTNTKVQDATIKTLQEVVNSKQETLTAGDNISIDASNRISANVPQLEAGENISIDASNNISAKGYIFNGDTNGGFAEKYKQDSGDGGQIVNNTASGIASHAEGYNTTASGGYGAHAEGCETNASMDMAHAEGFRTTASGDYGAHAEGSCTSAIGNSAHAEGYGTPNYPIQALGRGSHAEGVGRIAQNEAEHAEGMFGVSHKNSDNFGDAGNTLHSIGNSYSRNNFHNAVEVMQNGDVYITGVGGYVGTDTKVQDATIKTLQGVITDINTSVAGKQDTLTAGTNITISGTTISATYQTATTADIEALFS